MAGESILIVDHAPVNLKLADILLRKEGFTVHAARDAAEALALLGGVSPDLMLVDLRLPGMDALELAHCVKADPRTRAIPVVVVSASSRVEDVSRARELGATEVVSHPVTDERVLAAVVRAVGGAKAAS